MKVALKESNYDPLPEGVYRLIVMDCTRQTNKSNKEEFNSWKLQVNEDSEFNEKTISFASNLESINAQYASFLKACGLPIDDLNLKEGIEIETNDFIGSELFAEVKIANNTMGKPANKFVWFKSIDEYQKQIQQASQKFARPAAKSAVTVQQSEEEEAAPNSATEQVNLVTKPVTKPVTTTSAPVASGKKLDFPA